MKNLIDKFNETFQESLKTIEHFRNSKDSMQPLVERLLQTDKNPCSFLTEPWAGSMYSADSFVGLLNNIHHALYDDGDITFVSVNGEPRIVFYNQYEDNFRDVVLTRQEKDMDKRYGNDSEVVVLDVTPSEFCDLVDCYHTSWVKECFKSDSKRNGVNFAVEHYKTYKCFDSSWVYEVI